MFFNKTLSFLLCGMPVLLMSCSDHVIDSNEDKTEVPEIEKVYPVNFRCLTLNHEGSGGDKPSISYIHNNGVIYADYFRQMNNAECVADPRSVTQIKEKLYIPHSSYWPVQSEKWSQNGIFVMGANDFICEKDIDLGEDFMPYMVQDLGGDSVLVVGNTKNDVPNAIIGNISPNATKFKLREFTIDFPVNRISKVGDKIIVGGNRTQSDGVYTYSKLGVMDIKGLNPANIKVVVDKVNLSSRYSPFVKDKYQRIWFGNQGGNSYVLQCVDPKSGKLIHEVSMPLTMSSINEMCFTMDNKGEHVYVRNHKAFYVISVDKPETPDEPVYEYRAHVGALNDLQMTKEGNLLFLNEVVTPFLPSELIELKPDKNAKWEIVKISEIGSVAKSIYVSKYEKNY